MMKYSKKWWNTLNKTWWNAVKVRQPWKVFSCRMRLSRFLMQDKTFPISYAGWDFLVFLCYMRLFGDFLVTFLLTLCWLFVDILLTFSGNLRTFRDIWGYLGTCGDIGQIFADIRSIKVLCKIRIWRNARRRRRRKKLILRPLRCTRSKSDNGH